MAWNEQKLQWFHISVTVCCIHIKPYTNIEKSTQWILFFVYVSVSIPMNSWKPWKFYYVTCCVLEYKVQLNYCLCFKVQWLASHDYIWNKKNKNKSKIGYSHVEIEYIAYKLIAIQRLAIMRYLLHRLQSLKHYYVSSHIRDANRHLVIRGLTKFFFLWRSPI